MSKWAYSTEGFDRIVHRVEGVETVTYAIGQGEPLVYFHGGGTFHGFEWVARAGRTSSASSAPTTRTSARAAMRAFDEMGDYVSHYELLFPALGLDTFHLAGASMGGHMAARYAAANPGRHRQAGADLGRRAEVGARRDARLQPRSRRRTCRRCSSPIPAWIEPYWPANPSPEWLAVRAPRIRRRVRLARGPRRHRPRAAPGAQGLRPADAAAVGRGRPDRPARLSRRTGRRSCRTPSWR